MKRSARNEYYRCINEYGFLPYGKATNYRYILARRFKISIQEVRRILEDK